MRRPLFLVALCLVIFASVRLKIGGCEPGGAGAQTLGAVYMPTVIGQVYQKEDQKIYLKSVFLVTSKPFGGSNDSKDSHNSEQLISIKGNLICELAQDQSAQDIPLGSRVRIKGNFVAFSRASNPGEFDQAVYYQSLGICGRLREACLQARGKAYWPLREGLFRIKEYFCQRLYRIFPQEEAGTMNALLLGDRSGLDSERKDLYQRAGILHILSISSLHITIIGMSIYKLLRRLGLPVTPAALMGSAVLLLYGCMTGFGVSACRAIGMYLIRMLGEILGRTYDMLTALGVMAAVMTLGNPFYLQNAGFLLSFTSLQGIGVVYPGLFPEGDIKKWRQSVGVSLSITLATMPVQLWFYQEIPVYGIIVNLLVLPFMKPLIITGLAVMLIPGLDLLGRVDCVVLQGYDILCGFFDSLPFCTWNPGRPALWQVTMYYGMLLGTAAFVRRYRTAPAKGFGAKLCLGCSGQEARRRRLGLYGGGIVLAAVLVLNLRPPSVNRVIFLDVGQGDCILLQTASGQNYLFDCGSSRRKNVGRYVLLPCLKYYGIHRLDAVFLSHEDADHVNGIAELLELGERNGITVEQLVLPAAAMPAARGTPGAAQSNSPGTAQSKTLKTAGSGNPGTAQDEDAQAGWRQVLEAAENVPGKGPAIRYLAAGDTWECAAARFVCLHPAKSFSSGESNAGSACIYVEFIREKGEALSPWTLLLTGDVEGEGEKELLKALKERQIHGLTVLKAAHHGSRGSTPRELLEQTAPAAAVISCGRNNRYGHPHEELLERLEEQNSKILRTDRSGAVILYFRKSRVETGLWLQH
ncbi:MAG: DNA internalization-related competence protein ComEC/Rec2 [Acetatifactor sp.]|nr:DNA internalization-related competence protein ComEC/Rec2 [Acetatifactor sp.]